MKCLELPSKSASEPDAAQLAPADIALLMLKTRRAWTRDDVSIRLDLELAGAVTTPYTKNGAGSFSRAIPYARLADFAAAQHLAPRPITSCLLRPAALGSISPTGKALANFATRGKPRHKTRYSREGGRPKNKEGRGLLFCKSFSARTDLCSRVLHVQADCVRTPVTVA